MKDWTLQNDATNAMDIIQGRPSLREIERHIMSIVDGYDDKGTIEYIKGEWCFSIDYEVKNCKAEYSCPWLTFQGDSVECPWTDIVFDIDCQPEVNEPPSGPDILDYSDYL